MVSLTSIECLLSYESPPYHAWSQSSQTLSTDAVSGARPGGKVNDLSAPAAKQGLTLVHCSAKLEPFLTQKHILNTPHTPCHLLNTPDTTPDCNPCHTEGA
jgi:hypothetical protein